MPAETIIPRATACMDRTPSQRWSGVVGLATEKTVHCSRDPGRLLSRLLPDALREFDRWVDYECGAGCRKRLFSTMGRSFAVERWRPGAKSAGSGWSLFSPARRHKTPTQ